MKKCKKFIFFTPHKYLVYPDLSDHAFPPTIVSTIYNSNSLAAASTDLSASLGNI
jgi:hypothetical protein